MADERSFPDVEFVDTNTETILNEMIDDYEAESGRTLAAADPERMRLLWEAALISQERSYINIAAKRNLGRYATGAYLDSFSEMFNNITRAQATPASTVLRFSVLEAMEEGILIQEGTEVTTDGTIIFVTIEEAEIKPGTLSVDVIAECAEDGSVGNGYRPGELCNMISPIPYVDSVTNLITTENGTDEETDDELYQRGRESYEGFSAAGTAGAYAYHVKKHNPAVADVYVGELDPGQTGITILMDTGVPSEQTVEEIQEYISSDEIRATTDHVIVSAPRPVYYSIELTYYGAERPAVGGDELSELVEQAAERYITWQSSKLGRRINPGKLTTMIIQAGADRVEIKSPPDLKLGERECAVLSGKPVLTYGGEEE